MPLAEKFFVPKKRKTAGSAIVRRESGREAWKACKVLAVMQRKKLTEQGYKSTI